MIHSLFGIGIYDVRFPKVEKETSKNFVTGTVFGDSYKVQSVTFSQKSRDLKISLLRPVLNPRGILPYQEVGGLGPGIEVRGKIWGKVQSSSPNKRKNLGSSVTTRCKNWERITILGAFGVISEIQRAKFGVSVTYIFGGKICGSDMNFRGKIWGQALPTSLYGSTPSGF